MREEERRETAKVPGLGDPLGVKEENPRHPPKPLPPNQDNPQVETAKKTVPPDRPASPMDVPTTASSTSESLTTTMDLNLMKEKVPDTEGKVSKEEPSLPQFILAPAFMDIVCPECGALLQGASPTNLKNRQLQHPFGDPPLGGVPCRFKGKMFKTPVVRIDLL